MATARKSPIEVGSVVVLVSQPGGIRFSVGSIDYEEQTADCWAYAPGDVFRADIPLAILMVVDSPDGE